MPNRVLQAICAESWAITPTALQNIVSIATRQNETVEAVEKQLGKQLQNTQTVSVRGNTAILPVTGPIFRYANLFTQISGATSIEVLARDFNEALENDAIDQIILEIDSPGGQVAGVSEFADMVRAADKPVVAYVSDLGASAAYWIASAADEIILSKTSSVGSIGVVATLSTRKDDGSLEIVSTQSPNKRPDVETDEGREQIQSHVDALAKVFVSAVADFRGIDEETVLSTFGQGGLLVGADAVKVGMADRVGSLESLIAGFSGTNSIGAVIMPQDRQAADAPETKPVAITVESVKADNPDIYKAIYNEGLEAGKAAECERIKGVESQLIPGHEALIESLKFDGKSTGADAAVKIVAAHKEQMSSSLASIKNAAQKPVETVTTPDIEGSTDGLPLEDQCKSDWDKDANLREEFGSFESYLAFMKNDAAGNVGIFGGRK